MEEKKLEIKIYPVVSSNIAFAGYDKDSETLDIIFKNGTKYRYEDVPEAIYKRIFSSDSPGKFVRDVIAKSYPFKKI